MTSSRPKRSFNRQPSPIDCKNSYQGARVVKGDYNNHYNFPLPPNLPAQTSGIPLQGDNDSGTVAHREAFVTYLARPGEVWTPREHRLATDGSVFIGRRILSSPTTRSHSPPSYASPNGTRRSLSPSSLRSGESLDRLASQLRNSSIIESDEETDGDEEQCNDPPSRLAVAPYADQSTPTQQNFSPICAPTSRDGEVTRPPSEQPPNLDDPQYEYRVKSASPYDSDIPPESLLGNGRRLPSPHAKSYMSILRDNNLFSFLALWEPKYSSDDPVEIGDVGFFDGQGGFYSIFNLFLDYQSNIDRGYNPPPDLTSSDTIQKQILFNVGVKVIQRGRLREGEPFAVTSGYMRNSDRVPNSDSGDESKAKPAEDDQKIFVCTVLKDGPGSSIFLPLGGERQELSETMQRELLQTIKEGCPRWIPHCDKVLEQKGMSPGTSLIVVSRRCMSPSWAAASYIQPTAKEQQRKQGEIIFAKAERQKRDMVYTWPRTGIPGMDCDSAPALADIPDPPNPLPYDICVAIGGIVIAYERHKVKKASALSRIRTESASSRSSARSSFKTGLSKGINLIRKVIS